MRLSHVSHLSHQEIKVPSADSHIAPDSGKGASTPLTPAERQRRHRAKLRAERDTTITAHAAPVGYTLQLLRENEDLRQRLEHASRTAAEQAARIRQLRTELEPLQARLLGLQAVMRYLLGRSSPAFAQLARRHLQETGFIEWLDTD